MTTSAEPAGKTGRWVIPRDLSEWAPKEKLRQWISEEIGSLRWDNPDLQALQRSRPDFRPRVLLELLTFAYATGVFEAEDIYGQCLEDPHFRALCGGVPPEPGTIRRFRRENRGLLRWALVQLLKRAVRHRYELGEALLPPGVLRYLFDDATERLDLARYLDRIVYEY